MARKSDEKVNGAAEELRRDIAELSATALGRKYASEYTSWRNSKSRASATNNWDAEFSAFADFLGHLGPKPSDKHTLDRIDPTNPHYGPGLCRWADKRAQANNRGVSIALDIGAGAMPISEAADQLGMSPASVRRAFQRGEFDESDWTIGEPSRDGSPFGRDPRRYKPWPYRNDPDKRAIWERQFLETGGLETNKDRFQFLLRRCNRALGEWQHEMDVDAFRPQDEPEKWDHVQRTKAVVREATAQYPLWLKAVRAHKAKAFENRLLSGRVPPNDVPDEDDEDDGNNNWWKKL